MVQPLMLQFNGPYVRLADDLLARVAKISQNAEVRTSWDADKRLWCVSAHHRQGKAWDYIHVYRHDLADALLVAITEAEQCAWFRPEQPVHRTRMHIQHPAKDPA